MSRLVAVSMLAFFLATKALAHGPAPAVTTLLAREGEGATMVGLTRGIAYRVQDGFRFVCPETWGGDATAPAAGMPDGPAVIASERLYLVEPDGRVAPHAKQAGEGVALASNHDTLFGIFKRAGQRELRRISRSENDLVHSLDEPFGALAANDSELSLLSWAEDVLVLQTFSLSGQPGRRVTWKAPSAVAYAELRRAADQLYVAIWGSAAPWVTLGRATAQGFETLSEARSEIGGPLTLSNGTYVAMDGSFAALDQAVTPFGRDDYVTCLGSYAGLSYACAHGDLLHVDQNGLGAPLFELASLHEPDYQGLPAPAQRDCLARWLDLQEHVASASDANALPDATTADAGASPVRAPDAAARSDDAEASAADPAGCALGSGTAHAAWLNAMLLVALAARRRWM